VTNRYVYHNCGPLSHRSSAAPSSRCALVILSPGRTPLMDASFYGHEDACRVLLDAGADIHFKDQQIGADAILCAVQEGFESIWMLLLDRGARPDAHLCSGENAISLLLLSPEVSPQHVSHFLGLGVKPDAVNVRTGESALHLAARYGANGPSGVLQLLVKHGANVSLADKVGRSPSHVAVVEGQYDALSALIELGADIQCEDQAGRALVHLAARAMSANILLHLVESGCDVNVRDKHGRTPLMHACSSDEASIDDRIRRNGHDTLSVIAAILDSGARVNQRDIRGLTALHIACALGRQDYALHLILAGANMDARARTRRTPLHLAAMSNQLEVIRMLLKRGANINTVDERGNSVLHSAAARGDASVVRELLRHVASDCGRNLSGRSALDIAARAGHFQVAVALLEAQSALLTGVEAAEQRRSAVAAGRRHRRCQLVGLLVSYSVTNAEEATGDTEEHSKGVPGDKDWTPLVDDGEVIGETKLLLDMLSGSRRKDVRPRSHGRMVSSVK
jgi:uncharacterized protein